LEEEKRKRKSEKERNENEKEKENTPLSSIEIIAKPRDPPKHALKEDLRRASLWKCTLTK